MSEIVHGVKTFAPLLPLICKGALLSIVAESASVLTVRLSETPLMYSFTPAAVLDPEYVTVTKYFIPTDNADVDVTEIVLLAPASFLKIILINLVVFNTPIEYPLDCAVKSCLEIIIPFDDIVATLTIINIENGDVLSNDTLAGDERLQY